VNSKIWWRQLAAPFLFVVGAIALRSRVVESPEMATQVTRGLVGPATWPTIMMWIVAAFSLIWLLQRALNIVRANAYPSKAVALIDAPSDDALATPFSILIGLGIVLILAYGYLLAVMGFATSTLLYLVAWCFLGGIRKPLQIGLISLLGTIVLLYLFVKLASMPLDRGQGVMGEFSIALYRLLGIY
jgi:putative tricarboxylic transport membrane protein